MKIAVGCDHAGFVLKSAVTEALGRRAGVEVVDFGTHSEELKQLIINADVSCVLFDGDFEKIFLEMAVEIESVV